MPLGGLAPAVLSLQPRSVGTPFLSTLYVGILLQNILSVKGKNRKNSEKVQALE